LVADLRKFKDWGWFNIFFSKIPAELGYGTTTQEEETRFVAETKPARVWGALTYYVLAAQAIELYGCGKGQGSEEGKKMHRKETRVSPGSHYGCSLSEGVGSCGVKHSPEVPYHGCWVVNPIKGVQPPIKGKEKEGRDVYTAFNVRNQGWRGSGGKGVGEGGVKS